MGSISGPHASPHFTEAFVRSQEDQKYPGQNFSLKTSFIAHNNAIQEFAMELTFSEFLQAHLVKLL
jgi:hypothetical protein